MVPRDLVLQNDRILLRQLQREDLSPLLELTQDPTLWTYFTYDLSTLAGLEAWAAGHFAEERFQFVVVDQASHF